MALSTIYSPTVTRAGYLALEDPSAQGVYTQPNRRIEGFGVDADPNIGSFPVHPVGHKYAVGVMMGKEHTQLNLTGSPAINDLVYLLSSLLQTPVYSGGAWVFTPDSFQPDVFSTYTIGVGDNRQFAVAAGCYCDSLTLTFPPNAALTMQAQMMGKGIDDTTALPGSGITSIPLVPLQPRQTDVYVADTVSGLDTATKLTDLTATWGLSNVRGMVYANSSTERSFSMLTDLAGRMTSSFVIPHDNTIATGFMADVRAAKNFFFRIRNSFTYNGNSYSITIDEGANFAQNAGSRGDNQGLYASTWPLEARTDDTLGGAVKITIATDMATL